MAKLVSGARTRVCYVAPGIQKPTAIALSSVVAANPGLRVSVSVDFNEAVLRMGYESLEAVELLQKSGIEVANSPGLRAAVLVVDTNQLSGFLLPVISVASYARLLTPC